MPGSGAGEELVEVDADLAAVETVALAFHDPRVAECGACVAGGFPQAGAGLRGVLCGPKRVGQLVVACALRVQCEVGDQLACRHALGRSIGSVDPQRAEKGNRERRLSRGLGFLLLRSCERRGRGVRWCCGRFMGGRLVRVGGRCVPVWTRYNVSASGGWKRSESGTGGRRWWRCGVGGLLRAATPVPGLRCVPRG